MDEFEQFDPEAGDQFDPEADLDDTPAGGADFEFDDAEEAGDDLFAFDDDTAGAEAIDEGLDESFDIEAEFDEAEEPGEAGVESAYAATYEDMLVADADNPASFPPELDIDVPEPVDGYPWVDTDALGAAEDQPWMNTVDAGAYAIDDHDDPAAEALARFWQS